MRRHNVEPEKKEQPAPANTQCAAFGCPLIGTISAVGGGDWWCRFHYGAKASDLQRITAQIRLLMRTHHEPVERMEDLVTKEDGSIDVDYYRAEIRRIKAKKPDAEALEERRAIQGEGA